MTAQAKLKEQLLSFFDEASKEYPHVFLVDFVKNPKSNEFSFVVDGVTPVQLAEITHISRLISRQIDEQIEDETAFRYQVTTPGADKPLKMPKQYFKHVGRTLICTLQDETELSGELIEATDSGVVIKTAANKKKNIESEEHSLDFNQIKEAKIKLAF